MRALIKIFYEPSTRNPNAWWDSYYNYNDNIVTFNNEKELKAKIKEMLNNDGALNKDFRFSPMYRDFEDKAVKVGYVVNVYTIDREGTHLYFTAWIEVIPFVTKTLEEALK